MVSGGDGDEIGSWERINYGNFQDFVNCDTWFKRCCHNNIIIKKLLKTNQDDQSELNIFLQKKSFIELFE